VVGFIGSKLLPNLINILNHVDIFNEVYRYCIHVQHSVDCAIVWHYYDDAFALFCSILVSSFCFEGFVVIRRFFFALQFTVL